MINLSEDEYLDRNELQNIEDVEIRESLGFSELRHQRGIGGGGRESRNLSAQKQRVINLGSVTLFDSKTKENSMITNSSSHKKSRRNRGSDFKSFDMSAMTKFKKARVNAKKNFVLVQAKPHP